MVKHLAVAAALLVGSAAALGTNYEHDAKTTYCWAIPQPTNRTQLSEADRTPEYAGADKCPLLIELVLSSTTVAVFEPVTVQWTVTAAFSGANAIDHDKIYVGKDSKGDNAQIVHSNVHSCVFGTGCDPFNDGKELVDKTVNKIANFTDAKATFEDTFQFPTPGVYSVLAHIILPDANASSRFDYAVYTKVIVLTATNAPDTSAPTPTTAPVETPTSNESSDSGGLSQAATVGIIVGCIVGVVAIIVVVIILRRRKSTYGGANYRPAPLTDTSETIGGGPKMQQSAVTMINSTTGFESAWGGDAQRPTMDQTNDSNVSSNGYAAPTTNSQDGNTFSRAMQVQDLSASTSAFSNTGGRKKRVDSDVEL